MALQPQTIDVPLIAMRQSWPETAGVAGRLLRLNNAIAKRWMPSEAGSRLRVEKRDGFSAFGAEVRGTDGSASTKSMDGVSMLASRGTQLLAVANANIFAAARSNLTWNTPDYVCPTNVLTEASVLNRGTVDELIDSCHLSGVRQTMRTWTTFQGVDYLSYFHIVDNDGTVIRETTAAGIGYTPTLMSKCIADGQRFWLIIKPANPLVAYGIFVYDTNGELIGSDTASVSQDADYFDIHLNTQTGGNGFVFLQRSGAGPNFRTRKITWNGSAIVVGAPVSSAGGCSTGRVAFIRNSGSNHKYYAVTVDGAGPYDFYIWTIDDTTLAASSVTLALAQAVAPVEISGVSDPTGPVHHVLLSFLHATTPQRNYTEIWTSTAGTPALAKTCGTVSIVSRAFPIGEKYYAVVYYQGDPSAIALTNNIQQSTFYLLDLDWSGTFQICGEWCKGTAYADWQRPADATKWFHVSSGEIHNVDDTVHVALNYRARSFTTQATIARKLTIGTAGIGFKDILGEKAVNTVGIKDFGFGSELRRAVEFANETLIPGPRTTSWTGNATNHGISLVPEMFAPVTAVGGGTGLTPNGTYEVVCVAEWTDANGNRVRSIAGPPYAFTQGGGERRVTYSGLNLQNEVGKDDLVISLYRTAFINGIQSQQHYKVTNDLSPLLNVAGDPLNPTWSFEDNMTDADAANNEILYTDKGFLDKYPCPSFSDGCADADRAYVVGADGAVWFSGSKAEGDAVWFSPAFRLLLNNDIARSVAILDTTLVIFGQKYNVYVVPISALPGNDGSGGIPTPRALPLNHGCTGPVALCSEGILFPSTQGGIWLITRGLTDVFAGKDVKEFVEENGPCVDMYIDDAGRICCLLNSGDFAVYDTVTQAWSTYTLPEPVLCASVNSGVLVVARGEATLVYEQRAGAVDDGNDSEDTPIPIVSTVKVQFQLGGVRNFKRIWNIQFEGKYRGVHELTVRGYFDDNDTEVVETYEFEPEANVPYIYELPPKVEECASLALEFEDSFPDGASAGFSLEMLGFELGIQKGLDRLSPTSRRKPAR